jgi:ribosomal-protein-alanine N-acetyltransferase
MLQPNFDLFLMLKTKRLFLRRVIDVDVKEILEVLSDPETMKYIPRPLLKNTKDALQHIPSVDSKLETQEGIKWAIALKGGPKLIGITKDYRIGPENYRTEIGYMRLP